MAWTNPRTWTAEQIVLASEMNTDIRDNMNELAVHDHSGGSGSGTRALGGIGTGLTVIYMRDGAGPSTPTGTISAVFTTGSRLAMLSSGGTTVLFATSGHEHGITQQQIIQEGPTGATVVDLGAVRFYQGPTTSGLGTSTGTLSTSVAIGGTGKRSAAINAGFLIIGPTANSSTFTVEMFRAATSIKTGVFSWSPPAAGTNTARLCAVGTIDPTLASATYSYSVVIAQTGGDTNTFYLPGAFINVQEISVP